MALHALTPADAAAERLPLDVDDLLDDASITLDQRVAVVTAAPAPPRVRAEAPLAAPVVPIDTTDADARWEMAEWAALGAALVVLGRLVAFVLG